MSRVVRIPVTVAKGVDVLVARDGRLLALEANAPFGFDVTDPSQGRWVARAALVLRPLLAVPPA